MKNKIKVILTGLILVLSFFVWKDEVYAAADCDNYACATCIYDSEVFSGRKYTYEIQANGDGSINISFKTGSLPLGLSIINQIESNYFKNSETNQIECYSISEHYTNPTSQSGRADLWPSNKTQEETKSKRVHILNATSDSTNNNKKVSDTSGSGIISLEPEFGVYCGYKDGFYFKYSGFSKEDLFYFDTNFESYGTGIAIEYGRPGKRFDDAEETAWLKSKGLIDENGNFTCPVNPFGSELGEAIEKGCGPSNCNILGVETAYQSYTCNYTGQATGSNLNISHICEGENCHWEIKYPDGTTETPPYNTFLPTETCNDIYFTYTDKKIHQIFEDNWGTDLTLNDVCKDNEQSDIEYFCSGNCDYKEIICPVPEGCEGILGTELLGIIQEILNYIQIAAPILLIVFGVVDFGQAVLTDDKDALKKATSKFTKRAIACIAIFFAPLIINFLLGLIENITTDPTCGIR